LKIAGGINVCCSIIAKASNQLEEHTRMFEEERRILMKIYDTLAMKTIVINFHKKNCILVKLNCLCQTIHGTLNRAPDTDCEVK